MAFAVAESKETPELEAVNQFTLLKIGRVENHTVTKVADENLTCDHKSIYTTVLNIDSMAKLCKSPVLANISEELYYKKHVEI